MIDCDSSVLYLKMLTARFKAIEKYAKEAIEAIARLDEDGEQECYRGIENEVAGINQDWERDRKNTPHTELDEKKLARAASSLGMTPAELEKRIRECIKQLPA